MFIPADYGQINWRMAGAALPNGAEVTMGFVQGAEDMEPAQVAEDAAQAWIDNWLDVQVSDVTLVDVLVKFGPNETGPQAEFAVGQTGGENEDPLDPNTALLVRKITALGGRKNRGRFFIPGLPEDISASGGVVAATPLGVYQTRATQFLADLIADDIEPVVLHSEQRIGELPRLITSFSVQGTLATQRRRLRR